MAEKRNHTKVIQLLKKAAVSNQPTPTETSTTAGVPEVTVSSLIKISMITSAAIILYFDKISMIVNLCGGFGLRRFVAAVIFYRLVLSSWCLFIMQLLMAGLTWY